LHLGRGEKDSITCIKKKGKGIIQRDGRGGGEGIANWGELTAIRGGKKSVLTLLRRGTVFQEKRQLAGGGPQSPGQNPFHRKGGGGVGFSQEEGAADA